MTFNTRLIISRDVVYHEDLFLFHHISSASEIKNPFPDLVLPKLSNKPDEIPSYDFPLSNNSATNISSSLEVMPNTSTESPPTSLDNIYTMNFQTLYSNLNNTPTEIVLAPRRTKITKPPSYLREYHCNLLHNIPIPPMTSKFLLKAMISYNKPQTELS